MACCIYRSLNNYFPCVMKNTDKLSLKQWLSLYSGKYNINWFALLCLDHKRSDDSGFLINWMSSFGCICCCVIQKIVAYAFLLYIDFKSIDISKKVLVTVGCVIKTVSVTFLLFQMLFIIAWRFYLCYQQLLFGSCMVLFL